MMSELEGISLSQHVSTIVSHYGLLGIFLLMTLESACIPIPSEAVVTYAGYLVFQGSLSFWSVVIVSTLANVFGSLIAYAVGYYGGRPLIVHLGRFILLNERHLERAERWFARRGEWTVFITRLLPALRTFISLPAGIGKMRLGRFVLFTTLGALPWNYALARAGFALGQHWTQVAHIIKPITYVAALALAAAVVWWWIGRNARDNGAG